MKRLSKYLLTIGIVVLWITLSADSAFGKSTVYDKYEYDAVNTPLITLSLRNIFDREEACLAGFRYGTFLPRLGVAGEAELLTEESSENADAPEAEGSKPEESLAQNEAAAAQSDDGSAASGAAATQTDDSLAASGDAVTQTEEGSAAGADAVTQTEEGSAAGSDAATRTEGGSEKSGDAAAQTEGAASLEDNTGAGADTGMINAEGSEDGTGADPGETTALQNEEGVSVNADETMPKETKELTREVYVLSEVDDDYFCDALFIGDSRTVGLSEYCPELMDRATFYSKISMTIYDFDKKEIIEVPVVTDEEAQADAGSQTVEGENNSGSDENNEGAGESAGDAGEAENAESPATEESQAEAVNGDAGSSDDSALTEMVTIEEALNRQQFGKIYIMLGLNELGSGTSETFAENYGKVVNRIRELQPDAQIYIQGIMHVTAAKSSKDKVFKNDTINERNAAIAELADNQHVFYINMNEATDDEEGALTQDLSFDNVHLKAKSYALWYDYLKTHAYIKTVEKIQTE